VYDLIMEIPPTKSIGGLRYQFECDSEILKVLIVSVRARVLALALTLALFQYPERTKVATL